MKKLSLLTCFLLGLGASLPASAKLYKWTDHNGVVHYGETIPPEFAGQQKTQIREGWRKDESAEDRAKRQAAEAAAAAKGRKTADDSASAVEQKRRDNALTSTYTTSKEIDLARDRNLEQVSARVRSITAQERIYQEKLISLKTEEQGFLTRNKKVPPSLQDELKETQARIQRITDDLKKTKEEEASIRKRFDDDKKRFNELTGR